MSVPGNSTVPAQDDETRRLATLRGYGVVGTGHERRFDDLVALASHLCATPVALVSLVEEEQLFFKAAAGLALTSAPRVGSFCDYAIAQRSVFEVPDALDDARFRDYPLVTGDPHVRFYAGAPLIAPSGHAVGTLCVLDFAPRQLPIEKYGALQILARQVIAQLELGVAELRDPLTGLYNRCHLGDALARDVGRAVRQRSRLGLVEIDIDGCRRINEQHGYEAGDAVLRWVASVLTEMVRKEDVACRLGGEEFLIAMPDATLDVVAARAEKLRQRIESFAVELPGGGKCRLTVSAGVAGYPEHGQTPSELMSEAEHALRLAKAEGGNRVVVAPRGLDYRVTLQTPPAAAPTAGAAASRNREG